MNLTPYAIILALLSIAGAGFAGHYYGEKNQAIKDTAASAALVIKAQTADAVKIAALTKQLEAAQSEYDQTITQLDGYVLANPVGTVRLCSNPVSRSAVPSAPAHPSSAAAAGPTAGAVQPVPAGNSGAGTNGGADIGSLLGLLAVRADQIAAQLSALQSAEQNR